LIGEQFANGTNAAKNSTAIFSTSGNYALQVTVADSAGQQTNSILNLTVNYLKGDFDVDGRLTSADLDEMFLALCNSNAYQDLHHLPPDALATVRPAERQAIPAIRSPTGEGHAAAWHH
jgi:hypothetical protein